MATTVTGTGVPHVAPGRAGPGVLIRSGELALQFDAGRATALRLAEAGLFPHELSALFLTHHHSDHLVGLVDLVFARWLMGHGRHVPLPIHAPEGPAVRYLERMLDPWQDDIRARMEHVSRNDRPDPQICSFRPEAGKLARVWEREGVRVDVGLVHHEPIEPAVGFRIETPDGTVAISGDTRVCDELEELARGADVLVSEAFRKELVLRFADRAPHLRHVADYHADTVALGAVAQRAGVGQLVLTHLIPAPTDDAGRQGFVDDLRRGGYTGPLLVASDLDSVDLGAVR